MFSIRRDRQDAAARTQLESLMEAAGDAVFRLSADGHILYASKRATELVSPGGSLVGQPMTSVVLPADHPAIGVAITQALASANPIRVNVRIKTLSTSLWIELQVTAYPGPHGDTEVLAVGRDISSQQATEERLRHMATHDALTGAMTFS